MLNVPEEEAALLQGPTHRFELDDSLGTILSKIETLAYACPPGSWVWDLQSSLRYALERLPKEHQK